MDIALPRESLLRNEDQKQDLLATWRIDPTREPDFNRLVALAARVLDVPVAALFVNCDSQNFLKASIGFDASATEMTALLSRCKASSDGVFVILDAGRAPQP